MTDNKRIRFDNGSSIELVGDDSTHEYKSAGPIVLYPVEEHPGRWPVSDDPLPDLEGFTDIKRAWAWTPEVIFQLLVRSKHSILQLERDYEELRQANDENLKKATKATQKANECWFKVGQLERERDEYKAAMTTFQIGMQDRAKERDELRRRVEELEKAAPAQHVVTLTYAKGDPWPEIRES